MIDASLACEDGNSKLVEVVTVADVDAEKRVDDSLVQIWKLRCGHKAKLLFRLWVQGLVNILRLKFRRDLVSILLLILELGFVKVLSLSLIEILEI